MEAIGAQAQVDRESMVVVYDAGTGRIAHIHHVVTARGGHHPDDQELERAALEHAAETAARRGASKRKKMLTAHIDPNTFELDVPYKLDIKKRTLVKLTVKRRR
jgi:hypothetical protein